MFVVLGQMPVQTLIFAPFGALGKLLPHKQQLFTRITPHIGVIRAQIGEFLPVVAVHFVNQGAFAMNHFIVRQRQHKMLAVGIHLVESQLVVVVFAEYRIEAEIVQRVVHEAQIPFEIKAQPTVHQMLRHFRERGGFFSDHQRRWHALVNDLIEFFDKGNGFDVVAATLLIRLPLAFRARIVQV